MLGSLRTAFAGILLSACVALGAGPAPTIRLPTSPVVPQPLPGPPDAVLKLSADTLYVIDSDVPVIVLASPRGLVSVSEEAGPLRIRGRFIDGAGKAESRTYKGKHVVTVEAVASGRVELLVIPVGATKEADVIRRVIDVDAGQGPIPPPKPKPDPDPKPDPVDPAAPIPVPGLRVLVVYESADIPRMPAAQSAILFSAKVREYLNAACVVGADGRTREWRMWDKDTATDGEAKLWQDAMKRPRGTVPTVLISNGKSGYEGPLPATADEFLALLRKYEGK